MFVLTDSQHYINVSEDLEAVNETPGKFEGVYFTLSFLICDPQFEVLDLCFGLEDFLMRFEVFPGCFRS